MSVNFNNSSRPVAGRAV